MVTELSKEEMNVASRVIANINDDLECMRIMFSLPKESRKRVRDRLSELSEFHCSESDCTNTVEKDKAFVMIIPADSEPWRKGTFYFCSAECIHNNTLPSDK